MTEINQHWISVKDRLPSDDQRVLLARMDALNDYSYPYEYPDCVELAFLGVLGAWISDGNEDEIIELEDVTHWMPLPEPPGAA